GVLRGGFAVWRLAAGGNDGNDAARDDEKYGSRPQKLQQSFHRAHMKVIQDLKTELVERALPTITIWNRLEGRRLPRRQFHMKYLKPFPEEVVPFIPVH